MLTVTAGGHTATYTAGALLAHAGVVTVTIPKDVAYKRSMTYRAVPLAALLGGTAPRRSCVSSPATVSSPRCQRDILLAAGDSAPRACSRSSPPMRRGRR